MTDNFDPAAEERVRQFLEGRAKSPVHGHHADDAAELDAALKAEEHAGPPDWAKQGHDAPPGWRKGADGEYEEDR